MCEKQMLMQQKLQEIIDAHKDMQGALIPVMHEAQELYGYLPEEVIQKIADELRIPVAEVYGVATFYSQFSLEKKGENVISVCMGTACYVRGAADILEKFKTTLGIELGDCTEDGLFSLDACRCVGACGLAPVVTINKDVYGKVIPEQVEGILDIYRKKAEGGAN